MLAALILSLTLSQSVVKQCKESCAMQDGFMKDCEKEMPRATCKKLSDENRKQCDAQCVQVGKLVPGGVPGGG